VRAVTVVRQRAVTAGTGQGLRPTAPTCGRCRSPFRRFHQMN